MQKILFLKHKHKKENCFLSDDVVKTITIIAIMINIYYLNMINNSKILKFLEYKIKIRKQQIVQAPNDTHRDDLIFYQ